MSEFHYIAVLTYGKEKHGNQSDFKLGHGAGASVLLHLLGSQAREVSVPRAQYRYVHLDVKNARTCHYHLVLHITPDEKAQVEQICREQNSLSSWVYLWDHAGRHWLEFPARPRAPYHDAAQVGSICPKFNPTQASILTPLKPPEAKSSGGITLTQVDDWWWIAGNTYPHRYLLSELGARWSVKRQAWYFKGESLPQAIRDLAGIPPPVSGTNPGPKPDRPEVSVSISSLPSIPATDDMSPTSVPAVVLAVVEHESVAETEALGPVQDTPEALMRSVRTDDVTAALVAYIHDSERGRPVMVDFIGARNAVKQLLSKPFNPAYLGPRAEGSAFTLIDGSRYTPFRLPDTSYKTMSATLGGRMVEGRIVALDASVSAPHESCYVLVMHRIDLPPLSEMVDESWRQYLHYRQTPNRPEFSRYVAPDWASDLYNVYQALRTRIGRPLHERWMPWLFSQVADKPLSSIRLGIRDVTLCKYIAGYINPKARGLVECGAYRLTCRDMADLWAEVIVQNPQRADGITFSQP